MISLRNSLHLDKIRWLFWLRWKMFTRGFTGKGSAHLATRIIGIVFLALFVLGVGAAIAGGTFLAYRFLPTPANSEVLFLVLSGLFLLWLLLPLLEFTTNEGLDISKLALFPLTRGELMLSLIFSTLLDIPTIGLILVLGAVVAGWATSIPLALMALLTMLVFYVQLIAVSQLLLALLQKVLQSRRFRDISIIFVVLLSSSGYLCQFAVRGMLNQGFIDNMTHATYSSYLQWLPPGMAARAIQQASAGNWGMSFVWLLVLAIISLCFLYFWQLIVERGLTVAESAGSAKTVRQHARSLPEQSSTASGSLIKRLLPVEVRTMVQKDLKYFWRDPQIKAIFLQSMVSMLLLILYFSFSLLNNSRRSESFFAFIGPWIVPVVPLFVLFTLYSLAYNALGFERQAITTLLLFPINPKYILWGKNIAVFVVGMVEMVFLILIAAVITHAWLSVIPALIVGLAGIGIILGIGNFTTVYLPQKMRLARRGFQTRANTTAEGGCLRVLMSMAASLTMLVLLIPVAAAVIVPIIMHVQWVWVLSLPVSLIYGAVFYILVTNTVAPRILLKAPEIAGIVGKE
ncbi:putative ABC transporter permease subunit [Dictyobacter arantiisoli]|uniref:Uncharacterized protein n=1 Tax=Dictyobacter arantiisoli TaxID=2014874 RepID=A0A5A5T5J2_9CHLR|nr:hypothetical protein [Dictyobacter arantiisoli]GCF06597.1 hypothetical protein KDI_01610 [Dictyobacter arantiisoli]